MFALALVIGRATALTLTALSLIVASSLASSASAQSAEPIAQQPADESAQLRVKLQRSLPEMRLQQLRPSELLGLYEGITEDGNWLYINREGTRILVGQMFALDNGRVRDLSAQHRQGWVRNLLSGVPAAEYIRYSPAKVKHEVVVFTDIDCGYCRLLHREMSQLNELGIAVSYLAFPRAGLDSKAHAKAVAAWCAKDPTAALTGLKANQLAIADVPQRKDCDRQMVARQFQLGEQLGVTGTPALVLESGRVVPGYVPAAEMAAMLAQSQTEASRP